MVCGTDMVYSNNASPRKARKKLLKIGLRYQLECTQVPLSSSVSLAAADEPHVYFFQKFSPWEIVRHDIVYPIRFFGHVEILPDGS